MAEFQVVARHWKRMCKRYWRVETCHGCPIAEHEHAYEACSAYETDIVKMEELVMSWAAEHPEPVYPTWVEWLYSQGLMTDVIDGKGGNFLYNLASEPIPADIAQKLGIEPKKG